jgi:hypothetical protein
VSIRRHFKRDLRSEYHFNHTAWATFPKFLVTDTQKTHSSSASTRREAVTESINEHMPRRPPEPFPT